MRCLVIIIILSMIGVWMTLIAQGKMHYIDQKMNALLDYLASNHPIYLSARYITELGSKPFLVPFTIGMAFLLFALFRSWEPSLIFAGGTLITYLCNLLIKEIIQRERPRIFME